MMQEQMQIAGLRKQIRLMFDAIRALLQGKTLSGDSAKFYSPEHKQHFEAKNIQFKIEKESCNPNKLHLSINGTNIIDWCKEQYAYLKQTVKPRISPPSKPRLNKSKCFRR